MSDPIPAPPLPEAVRAAIAADLAPVRPLPAPWRRALWFAPIAALVVFASPVVWGLRGNLTVLPSWASWGLSAVQALAGLVVVGAGLREAVPGRGLATRTLALLVGVATALFLGITLTSAWLWPTRVPIGTAVRWIWECAGMASIIGVPALALVAGLVLRLLPERPAIAGALCGLGAGLLTDAGVRLFCFVDDAWHIVLAHGGPIVGLMAAGALLAVALDRLDAPAARRAGRSR